MSDPEPALDIAHRMLRDTRSALESKDYDAFAAHFLLPQRLETMDGVIEVETPEELKRQFEGVVNHWNTLGVTRIVRDCKEASYKTKDQIEYAYETTVYRGEEVLATPHTAFAMLRRVGGRWLIAYTMYGISEDSGNGPRLYFGAKGREPAAAS